MERDARRVGHPARERDAGSATRRRSRSSCPQWLIELYTYEDDLVLDPFIGSGSTLVAAARARPARSSATTSTPTYVDIAERRLAEVDDRRYPSPRGGRRRRRRLPADDATTSRHGRRREGKAAQALAEQLLGADGLRRSSAKNVRVRGTGVDRQLRGRRRPARSELVVRRVGRVHVEPGRPPADRHGVEGARPRLGPPRGTPTERPLILLSSHLPKPGSEGDLALERAARVGAPIFDVVRHDSTRRATTAARLRARATAPLPGIWTTAELDR